MKPANWDYQTEVHNFEYMFMKSCLQRLSTRELRVEDIRILKIGVRENRIPLNLRQVRVISNDNKNCKSISDHFLEATVLFNGYPYEIVFTLFIDEYQGVRRYVYITGLHEYAAEPSELFKILRDTSIRYSPLRNKFLGLKPPVFQRQLTIEVEEIEITLTSLTELFIPDYIKDSLKLFIETVKKWNDIQQPLRYLLNGKPGTGKTMIIRAIANELKGKATCIFLNGSDDRIDALFELSKCFSPVIVCIDDIDLLVKNRELSLKNDIVGKFLQYLDGFTRNGMFILATTNDKTIVDVATSRPGRFDAILDINQIDALFYTDFINSKTDSKEISRLLSSEFILEVLNARKVTGAFIANVIKRLEIELQVRGKCLTIDETMNLIANIEKGFYKTEEIYTGFKI